MLEQDLYTRHEDTSKSVGSRSFELVEGFVRGRVSVIMPAYNEAEGLSKSVDKVKKRFGAIWDDCEIIVVDDGSTDRTRNVFFENSLFEGIKLVSYYKNQGKGYAFRKGFSRVTGEFTFLVDGDTEIMADDLIDYFQALKESDITIGSKRHPSSKVNTPTMRRFLSLGYNILERLLTGVKVSDTQAGFKGSKSTALYQIMPLLSVKKYAFDAEMLAVATLLNMKIRELPVQVELKASFRARHVFRMIIDLMGITYRLRVRRWYQKNLKAMSNTYTPIIQW